jgi:hypothetical protein
MLSRETLLATHLIALPLLLLERLTRVSMLSAWSPLTRSRLADLLKLCERRFRRVPQPPSLKPFHLRVGMAFLQSPQRG